MMIISQCNATFHSHYYVRRRKSLISVLNVILIVIDFVCVIARDRLALATSRVLKLELGGESAGNLGQSLEVPLYCNQTCIYRHSSELNEFGPFLLYFVTVL